MGLTVNTIVMKMCRLGYSNEVDEASKLSAAKAAVTAKQQMVVEAFKKAASLPPLTVQPSKPPQSQAANKLLMKLNMNRAQASSGSSANRAAQWSVENTV